MGSAFSVWIQIDWDGLVWGSLGWDVLFLEGKRGLLYILGLTACSVYRSYILAHL